jgi:hypothetical protein
MLNGCHTSVQQLARQTTKPSTNPYEQRVSSNVVQATASALQDLTIKFRKCQSNYLHSRLYYRLLSLFFLHDKPLFVIVCRSKN